MKKRRKFMVITVWLPDSNGVDSHIFLLDGETIDLLTATKGDFSMIDFPEDEFKEFGFILECDKLGFIKNETFDKLDDVNKGVLIIINKDFKGEIIDAINAKNNLDLDYEIKPIIQDRENVKGDFYPCFINVLNKETGECRIETVTSIPPEYMEE